jgi:transcriptional regulator with XRE-family HTH domain
LTKQGASISRTSGPQARKEKEGEMAMDREKKRALAAAGFRIGDAADFLGLTEAERRYVELRVKLSQAVRRRREGLRLTQEQLARKLDSSQSRIAKLEAASADVSLDLLFRGLFAVGGDLDDLTHGAAAQPGEGARPRTAGFIEGEQAKRASTRTKLPPKKAKLGRTRTRRQQEADAALR